jgi:Fe-S oxidoreductase
MVIDARKTLVEKGLAPGVVSAIALRIKETGNPHGLKEKGVSALIGKSASGQPEIALCLGSAARTHRPQTVHALGKVLHHLGIGFEVLEQETDSGFLSYQLGDFRTAADQAKNLTGQMNRIRAKKLVVLSASAYRMFTTRYARFGSPLPEGLKVLHVTEFLSELLDQSRLILKRKLDAHVTYQDPCCLARFTYILEPPRKLLAALSKFPVAEMNWSGRQARSCGGCGGVSFTYPEISEKTSKVRVEDALKTGAQILASADPECEEMLARVTRELEIKDIVELVAEAI